jgi:hypothetical protein
VERVTPQNVKVGLAPRRDKKKAAVVLDGRP